MESNGFVFYDNVPAGTLLRCWYCGVTGKTLARYEVSRGAFHLLIALVCADCTPRAESGDRRFHNGK